MSYKGDSEGYKGFLSATDGLKEDRQGDIKSQSIEHILSSSIQRAKEKISLMEHRERNERSQGNHGSLQKRQDRTNSQSKDGSSALAGAMRILQSRISELQKTIGGHDQQRAMLSSELDNAISQKKIILSSLEEAKRRNIALQQLAKQNKENIKELTIELEKYQAESQAQANVRIELQKSLKAAEVKVKNLEGKQAERSMQKRELGLPPSGKMSPAEMLYQAKMKELEDWENKLAEKERKLTERQSKLSEIEQSAIEDIRRSGQTAQISNKIAREMEMKNKQLSVCLQQAKKEVQRLSEEMYYTKNNDSSEHIEVYVQKINELEQELQRLRETTKGLQNSRGSIVRSPLEQLQQKHEKIETLKEELSDIRLKYEELFRRCKRAEDKAKHQEKDSKFHRNKFWQLKGVLSEIIDKIGKMPNAVTTQLRYLITKAHKVQDASLVREGILGTPTKSRSNSINSSKSKKKCIHLNTLEISRNSNNSQSGSKSRRSDRSNKSERKKKEVILSNHQQQNQNTVNLEKQVSDLRKEYKNLVKKMNNDEDEETRNKLNDLAFELQVKSEQLTKIRKASRAK